MIPPSHFGIGTPQPVRSFEDALRASRGSHFKVVFAKNGYDGGQIEEVINKLVPTVRAAGKTPIIVERASEIATECPTSLRGATVCYGAVSFNSSLTEGNRTAWRYSLHGDGTFDEKIFVDRNDNDRQIYVLPFQKAIDSAIASTQNASLPEIIDEYPFTSQTAAERTRRVHRNYMNILAAILALALYVGLCGITFHLPGHMALERELGISQLIEAMSPNVRLWHTQASRLLSIHLAFDMIYFPAWVISAIIISKIAFTSSSTGIFIVQHILTGLALSSCSLFGASFFRSSQLSGAVVCLTLLIMSVVAQLAGPFNTVSAGILIFFFPSMNYTFFLRQMAYFEARGTPASLVRSSTDLPFSIPGYIYWVLLIIHILVFPLLAAVVERTLFGTASKGRKVMRNTADTAPAIKLEGFSKIYGPNLLQRIFLPMVCIKPKKPVEAASSINLEVLHGQLNVLLGANGSGKSTTLEAVAGIKTVDGGSIEVDGTWGLGFCPQKNVIWDELTVFEHVATFTALKTMDTMPSNDEIKALIRSCDLEPKMNARAKTLSGGQKRKLQLAIMFAGGSKVCCVDEVSSGLDPLSRRKIWDILLAERGNRTFLFTTHFLDEADILSDYITILSKGKLVAQGASVELKQQFGGGYHIHVTRAEDDPVPDTFGQLSHTTIKDEVIFHASTSSEAASLVAKFHEQGVQDYHVRGPTIEDVFLRLAQEIRDDLPGSASGSEREAEKPSDVSVAIHPVTNLEQNYPTPALDLSTGKGTNMFQQTVVLLKKRFIVLKRNFIPYLIALALPIVVASLVTRFLRGFKGISCDNEETPLSAFMPDSRLLSYGIETVPIGPSSKINVQTLASFTGARINTFKVVETLEDFNSHIARNFRRTYPGGVFINDKPNSPPVFAHYANSYRTETSVMTQNLMNSLLTRIPIVAQYSRFDVVLPSDAGDLMQLIFYFGLTIVIYPIFFVLYPAIERLQKVRAMQYSNGIRAAPLWLAYTLFDFLTVVIVSVVSIGLFVMASSLWYSPGYLCITLILFGLTSTLLAYVVSLFAPSSLAAFSYMAIYQVVGFAISFISYSMILVYSTPDKIDYNINLAYFLFGIIMPPASLLRGLLVSLNEFSILCRGKEVVSYPAEITVYGGPILYLVLQSVILFCVVIIADSGYVPPFISRRFKNFSDPESTRPVGPDVHAEASRTESSEDPLRVLHLSKSFRSNEAVQDLSFGIQRNEVFGLLGPNGAGKSTTISLIRGDMPPNRRNGGSIFIENINITTHRQKARVNLGVCPQFDAIDKMTVVETLRFYARARGVPDIDRNVTAILRAVSLEEFKTRLTAQLSGGNKRKLSLGISLMGNPSVMLLDEPSSGMDAASKRVMWRTLNALTAGRALLITTHSMEEADALASRVGIMAGRMLAIGSSDDLRRRFGDGYHIHLILRSAPHSSADEMAHVRGWIGSSIPGAVIEDRSFHGQLRFRVPLDAQLTVAQPEGRGTQTQSGIAALFAFLEQSKQDLGFEHYSVSQATLDQVFLRIVGQHNVEEEEYRQQEKPKSNMRQGLKKIFSR